MFTSANFLKRNTIRNYKQVRIPWPFTHYPEFNQYSEILFFVDVINFSFRKGFTNLTFLLGLVSLCFFLYIEKTLNSLVIYYLQPFYSAKEPVIFEGFFSIKYLREESISIFFLVQWATLTWKRKVVNVTVTFFMYFLPFYFFKILFNFIQVNVLNFFTN